MFTNSSKRSKFIFSSKPLENDYFLQFRPKIKGINGGQKRKVIQYTINGRFIKIWDSISKAMEETNSFALIEAINNKSTSGGFQWRYWTLDFQERILPYTKENKQEVYCYNLNGEFLKKYESIFEAGNNLNIPHGNIVHHLKGKVKMCYGYYFSTEPKKFSTYERKHKFQKIVKITNLKTGEIQEFKSKREAERVLGINRATFTNALEKHNGVMIKKQLKFEEI